MITVAKDNSGDFNSIQQAVDSIPAGTPETIYTKKEYIKNALKSERIIYHLLVKALMIL